MNSVVRNYAQIAFNHRERGAHGGRIELYSKQLEQIESGAIQGTDKRALQDELIRLAAIKESVLQDAKADGPFVQAAIAGHFMVYPAQPDKRLDWVDAVYGRIKAAREYEDLAAYEQVVREIIAEDAVINTEFIRTMALSGSSLNPQSRLWHTEVGGSHDLKEAVVQWNQANPANSFHLIVVTPYEQEKQDERLRSVKQ